MSISAITMLGATNLLTPLSYANAATKYDDLTEAQLKANPLTFEMPDKDVMLYAHTMPNSYVVNYNGNGHTSGTMSGSTFTYDQTGNLQPNAYVKTGYTWSTWNEQADGEGTPHASGAAVHNWIDSGSMTIYAQWIANQYNIIYDLNDSDGTTTGSHTQTPASLAYDETGNIANPTRVGYSFAGWTISGMDGESHIVGGETSTADHASGVMGTGFKNLNANDGADVTFQATWNREKVDYKVEHYLETLTAGTYETLPEDTDNLSGDADTEVKPETHTYDGFTANPSNTPISGNIDADGNKVFRYEYTRNSYELELIAGRGVQSVTATGTVNTTGITTSDRTTDSFKYDEPIQLSYQLKSGYQTPVWSGYSGTASSFNMPYTDAAKELNATPIVYHITYDENGATTSAGNPTTYTVESGDINLAEPTGTHSTFLGWTGTDEPDTNPNVTIASGSIGDRSFTAVWQCNTGYHAQGSSDTGDINYGNCIQNTDTAYKVEHYFQNVAGTDYDYDNTKDETKSGTTDTTTTETGNVYPGYVVNHVDNDTIKGDGSTVIKVYYDRLSYSGNITDDTGIATTATGPYDEDGKHKYGDTVTLSAETESGYTFDHWTVVGDGINVTINSGDANKTFVMPASDVTITSYSTTNVYTLHLTKYGGSGSLEDGYTYTVEDTVTLTALTRDNSEFLGWSGMGLTSPQKTVTFNNRAEDSTYEAVWGCVPGYHASGANECVANQYHGTVEYDDGEHSSPEQIDFTYDQVTTLPNPTQSGYDFAGWDIIGMSGDVEHYIGELPVSGSSYSGSMATGYMNLSTDEGATDIIFRAKWTPRDDTEYVINHYYRDINQTTYTLSGTDTLSGTTDTPVVFTEKLQNYEGFTYSGGYVNEGNTTRPAGAGVTTGNIAKDGSLIINLYYDRNIHTVTLSGDEHVDTLSWTGAKAFDYGDDVTVEATAKEGYHFVNWTATPTPGS